MPVDCKNESLAIHLPSHGFRIRQHIIIFWSRIEHGVIFENTHKHTTNKEQLTSFAELHDRRLDVHIHELASITVSILGLLSLSGVKERVSRIVHALEMSHREGPDHLHPQRPELLQHVSAEHRGGVEVGTTFL